MKLFLSILSFALIVGVWTIALLFLPRGEVVYHCHLAEISPDYPIEVKKLCREKGK